MAMGMAMLREQKKKKDHAENLNFMPSEIFLWNIDETFSVFLQKKLVLSICVAMH